MNRTILRKFLPEIIGTFLGAVGGFIYWKYVGCRSGTCAIKSNWYLMVPWGAVLGYLAGSVAGDIIRKKKKPTETEDN
ncbi:MAG: hypothetical protein GX622_03125 [Bacteroidales bacterium]|nr:hypothetical protein [Bacteroidales bacterium]